MSYLRNTGFTNVYKLKGWEKEGLPVTRFRHIVSAMAVLLTFVLLRFFL